MPVVVGPVVQVAYEVADVEAAARGVAAALGAGPFLVREHPPLRWAVDGEGRTTCFDHVSAYGVWGDLQVELLVPGEGVISPALRRGPGLHHVARMCTDLEEASADLSRRGAPLVLRAETAGGTEFRFHDGGPLGHLVELYLRSEALEAHYAQVAAAAAGWDGRDPVRGARAASGR